MKAVVKEKKEARQNIIKKIAVMLIVQRALRYQPGISVHENEQKVREGADESLCGWNDCTDVRHKKKTAEGQKQQGGRRTL